MPKILAALLMKRNEEASTMKKPVKKNYTKIPFEISFKAPKCSKKFKLPSRSVVIHILFTLLFLFILFVLLMQIWYIVYYGCQTKKDTGYVCPFSGHGKQIQIGNDSVDSKEPSNGINNGLTACDIIQDEEKFDCFPRSIASEKECTARGCCWSTTNSSNVPWCFYPKRHASYKYVNSTKYKNGQTIIYELNKSSPYPNNVNFVKVEVSYETDTRLHVKISDASTQRYEPSYPEIPLLNIHSSNSPELTFEEKDDGLFGFSIKRNNGKTVFGAHVGGFIFSDQLLQISATTDNEHYLYGLGEHRNEFVLDDNWNVITLFNHGIPPTDGANGYGSHPFYLAVDQNDTESHGVFLLNSNAMDIILQPKGITYRSIGGVLDFYFFSGPKASDVVRQYTELIGKPFLPPFWSLGFHMCRFGLKTLTQTIDLYERTKLALIPFDVQWNDIDYMQNRNDFTIGDDFKELATFVQSLHKNGMHYIIILDPGVASSLKPGTYPPFDEGVKDQIFIKNSAGDILEGKVWNLNSATVFPDFSNPKTLEYWLKQLSDFHDKVPFDGLWLDMNEIENFVNGSLVGCGGNDTKWDEPPYVPRVYGGSLSYRTICMSAKHYSSIHYNLHNLHAFTETIATAFGLAELRGKRPFVLSRSTFAGFGHYGAHWTGDVYSSWDDMRHSVSDILSFNILGIPMIGADICGFNGNTTKELCQRWLQLGAFYPFSRSHNSDDAIDQDPVSMGKEVVRSTITALTIRYSMLPYLYTLFFKAHAYGDTVARPLFFEFPDEFQTYKINDQFLWGSGVMFVPVMRQGATWVSGYFPNAKFYDYYTSTSVGKSGWVKVNAPMDIIPIFIRGGHVIPQINPGLTTNETRKNDFFLTVALDEFKKANGDLLWDDGDSYYVFDREEYNNITFEVANNSLTSRINHFGYNTRMTLNRVNVLGLPSQVNKVYVNGKYHKQFNFDKQSLSLNIYELKEDLSNPLSINWVFK